MSLAQDYVKMLPEELVLNVLCRCKVADIISFGQTCHNFQDLTKLDILWKYLCNRDFGSCELGDVNSYQDLYVNLLHLYGCMIGTYQMVIGPYGGLLEIKYEAGTVIGIEWESPRKLTDPLKNKCLFTINGTTRPPTTICSPDNGPHPCHLTIDKRKGTVILHCEKPATHYENIRGEWEPNVFVTVNDYNPSIRRMFFSDVLRNELVNKLIIMPTLDDIPTELRDSNGSLPVQLITPGLFKGDYNCHGIEILMFRYKNEYEMHGIKVTGDINVPAGKVSVKINLRYPVNLSKEQQLSLSYLESMEPTLSTLPIDKLEEDIFLIPQDCEERAHAPPRCKARYHGFGQIAYPQFQDSSFVKTHVMIFNNDLIGVLWMELRSFSLYHRINQNFSKSILRNITSEL